MTEARVTHLRSIAVAMPDYEKQVEFYGGVWGLKQLESEPGLTYFAAEGSPEQYILRVRQADDKRIDVVSFGVADASAVDELATSLAADGVRFASEPGQLQTPGGGYGFRFFDPNGLTIEISADVEERPYRVLDPKEAIPQKLSHVVLHSPDPQATMDFYENKLGFKVSGWLADFFGFLRCTPDFHSLGWVKGPAGLDHISFEMRGYDEYMRGCGRALQNGVPMVWGIGKHAPADTTFAYFIDPSGNTSEYTAPQQLIVDDEIHKPTIWGPNEPEQWGTAIRNINMPENPEEEGRGVGRMQEDAGLWVAAPV